jgi:hypothetical protein
VSLSTRPPSALRVLLSEGSSLSARETLSALGPLGYRVDVCDPNPLCIGRFSRFVRAFHRCPSAGRDPRAYLQFVLDLLSRERYDVLLPVHEQAFLFARYRQMLPSTTGVALADFPAFLRVQSKTAFAALLDELGLPQPRTRIAYTRADLVRLVQTFPCFLKAAYGTAGRTVWRVDSREAFGQVLPMLDQQGLPDERSGMAVQEAMPGVLCQAQAVFEHGRLLAVHCTRQRAEGPGGSQSARLSVDHPPVQTHVARLGEHLHWHGPLALDYLFDEATSTPAYIEANPRLVEPMNAAASGLNLADMVVRMSLGETYPSWPPLVGHAGVRTHSLMPTLLGVAERDGSRLAVLRGIGDACLGRGAFEGSCEVATPVRQDAPSLVPLSAVIVQLLLDPASNRRIATRAISDYSLTPAAVDAILENRIYLRPFLDDSRRRSP